MREKMNYVYIVECADGSYYTGWTNNLEKRIQTHNAGKGAKYTKYRLPVKLVYSRTFETKKEAMSMEYRIKRYSRAEKELLIKGKQMKILFLDLDDTLLTSDKTISEGNLDAIRKMMVDGNKLVLCTGRPLFSVIQLAEKYDLIGENCLLAAMNGGQIVESGSMKELYRTGMKKEDVRKLFDEAHAYGLPVQTYSDDAVLIEKETEFVKWYSNRIKMPYKLVEDVLQVEDCPYYKCIVGHIDNHQILEKFHEYIRPIIGEDVVSFFSSPSLLEFGTDKATKGVAVRILCEKLGIDIADSIAVGDEENDISMIKAAGIGAAMINGKDEVKVSADVITENDNNHDAIAEVISKYVYGR